jgi:hypothetical protein
MPQAKSGYAANDQKMQPIFSKLQNVKNNPQILSQSGKISVYLSSENNNEKTVRGFWETIS